jgi:hypothetical protein
MYKNSNRMTMVISVVLAIIIIAVVIILVINATNKKPEVEDNAIDSGEAALVTISDGSGVRMTVRGKIVADEVHNSYQITVRPQSRIMNVYQGYLGTLTKSKVDTNNFEAYTEFAYALAHVGLMKGKESSIDVRGICPSGILTTFEVLDGDNTIKTLWHTSCAKDAESFIGKYNDVEKIFIGQIVDYKTLIKGVKF